MTGQPQKKPAQLSEHYYQENANALIDFVYQHYETLLDQREQHFYHTYFSLGQSAQQLYCRFVMRQRAYIRASKTSYPEIRDPLTALNELIEQGLCSVALADDIDQWLPLFRKDEIQAASPLAHHQPNTTGLPGDLSQSGNRQQGLLLEPDLFGCTPASLLLQTDAVYKIEFKDVLQIFQLLFFGDMHQDVSAFVLRDLGLTRFENYFQSGTSLPFATRDQLMAHLHYYQCIEKFDEVTKQDALALVELNDGLNELPTNIIDHDITLKRRQAKWSNRIARQLERLDSLDEAALIYAATDQPPARERLARIEARRNKPEAAFAICEAILENPADAEELDFAQQFSQPLAKKLGIDQPKFTKYSPPSVTLTLAPTALPVELATALHFARTGNCFYVENSLITAIFGLAMWDIIYAPLPGAFFHPFQTAPADFHERLFSERRCHLFANRRQQLEAEGLQQIVLTNLHNKRGTNNPLVNWHVINRHLIVLAMKRIPKNHWLALFDYLLRDIAGHRSGLPDLVYFSDEGDYQLLEVKGPGDQLQKNQRRWMQHFADSNIPHAVVKIKYSDD